MQYHNHNVDLTQNELDTKNLTTYLRDSYAINSVPNVGIAENDWSRQITKIAKPSSTILIAEQHASYNIIGRSNHAYVDNLYRWHISETMSAHGKLRFNYLFCDGAAVTMNPYETGGVNGNWGMWDSTK